MEAIALIGALLFIMIIVGSTIIIPLLIVRFSQGTRALKLLIILYSIICVLITWQLIHRQYMIMTMNTAHAVNFINNDTAAYKAQLSFTAEQSGEYLIVLFVNDQTIGEEIDRCRFKYLDTDPAKKDCLKIYTEKNIVIQLNDTKLYANELFNIIVFREPNMIYLKTFDAAKDQTFLISVTLDNAMKRLIKDRPSLKIMPFGAERISLFFHMIVIDIPFLTTALIMIFYLRKKIKERTILFSI